jgi:hypothetical protein
MSENKGAASDIAFASGVVEPRPHRLRICGLLARATSKNAPIRV